MKIYNKNSAIAIFDSGVGGVSIMNEIASLLPNEDIIYYADDFSCPYGGRSAEEIFFLSCKVIDFLLKKNIKIIVIACNSATTNAIHALRKKYSNISFIGAEPAVKTAVTNSCSGIVGVLATRSTIYSQQIVELSRKYGEGKVVLEQAGDGLVELVENGQENSEEAFKLLSNYINPMIEKGIDYLALGCTHYPFMVDTIYRVIGDNKISVINSGYPIAKRVEQVLLSEMSLQDSQEGGEYQFYCSSNSDDYIDKLKNRFNINTK